MTEDAPHPLDTATNIPVVAHGGIVGKGTIEGSILTVELSPEVASNFIDYIRMGLMSGFDLTPVYIEAGLTTHPIEWESHHG